VPTKKTTKRHSVRTKQRKPIIHPLGKLFFFLLFVAALGCVILLFTDDAPPVVEPPRDRAITNTTELQIALARQGFSPGSIDGTIGSQTRLALLAYQSAHEITLSGIFDSETAARLRIADPVHAKIELSKHDFAKVAAKPASWVERGQLDAMRYNSMLELIAEHAQTDPDYIRLLNPDHNWQALRAGDQIVVPHIPAFRIDREVAYVRIRLGERTLQAFDSNDQLRFHCPVSIARRVDKRPSGQLAVKVLVENPNYTFNPAILSATAAREGITQKFIIQPGPNNPVGSVWIGLNLPSYGIHGTPEPEKVGRTESSGCFRLANWNAETLLQAAWVGMPIQIDP
jgi:lipoprotein-anchoring transpeptidase ErfK/SrfK